MVETKSPQMLEQGRVILQFGEGDSVTMPGEAPPRGHSVVTSVGMSNLGKQLILSDITSRQAPSENDADLEANLLIYNKKYNHPVDWNPYISRASTFLPCRHTNVGNQIIIRNFLD